jgi:mannose-6-phosphate isomerase-like protein (cupin superfamily)
MAEQVAMISANNGVNFQLDRHGHIIRAIGNLQRSRRCLKIGTSNYAAGGPMEKQAKVVQLKTQLVKEGHTRTMLAETELMTLRIHCYAPGIGENALHSHTKEDHIFLVLQGTAQFNTGRDGQTMVSAGKNSAVVLPAGCYYQFCNSGTEPLVMARIGAGQDKADQRLNPDGTAIPGRTHEQGAAKPVLIENAFFE